MAEDTACDLTVEPGPAGSARLTIGIGDREAVIDLPRGEARTFIRALAAAIGDGRERTFVTESARG